MGLKAASATLSGLMFFAPSAWGEKADIENIPLGEAKTLQANSCNAFFTTESIAIRDKISCAFPGDTDGSKAKVFIAAISKHPEEMKAAIRKKFAQDFQGSELAESFAIELVAPESIRAYITREIAGIDGLSFVLNGQEISVADAAEVNPEGSNAASIGAVFPHPDVDAETSLEIEDGSFSFQLNGETVDQDNYKLDNGPLNFPTYGGDIFPSEHVLDAKYDENRKLEYIPMISPNLDEKYEIRIFVDGSLSLFSPGDDLGVELSTIDFGYGKDNSPVNNAIKKLEEDIEAANKSDNLDAAETARANTVNLASANEEAAAISSDHKMILEVKGSVDGLRENVIDQLKGNLELKPLAELQSFTPFSFLVELYSQDSYLIALGFAVEKDGKLVPTILFNTQVLPEIENIKIEKAKAAFDEDFNGIPEAELKIIAKLTQKGNLDGACNLADKIAGRHLAQLECNASEISYYGMKIGTPGDIAEKLPKLENGGIDWKEVCIIIASGLGGVLIAFLGVLLYHRLQKRKWGKKEKQKKGKKIQVW